MILTGYLKPRCEKFTLCINTRVQTLSKEGKRGILEASRRESSRRMRWNSNGYLSTGFPDILGSLLSN
jgi:hypothetical protein